MMAMEYETKLELLRALSRLERAMEELKQTAYDFRVLGDWMEAHDGD